MATQIAVPVVDIESLRMEVTKFREARMARSTELDYAHDWSTFRRWCLLAGCQFLPATPETLTLFIADQLQHKKVATVARYTAGVCFIHRREGYASPADDAVRQTLAGARRMRCEQPRQMRPLTVAQLRQVAELLTRDHATLSIRNRAIVVFGFATALRRSSLAGLRLEDVTFCDEGLIVCVRREKQDRRGDGRIVAAPFGQNELTCPVRALGCWLAVRGVLDGPLFTRLDNGRSGPLNPLTPNALWQIVKDSIARTGLDPRHYGPHSLRAGLITEAGICGVNSLVIANQSGHKSLDSLKRYFRPANLFKANASGLVGL